MKKKLLAILMVFALILPLVPTTNVVNAASTIPTKYRTPTDADFKPNGDGRWTYTGMYEYVIIPDKIHGQPVTSYDLMFSETEVKGVASTNKNVKSARMMFKSLLSDSLEIGYLDTSSIEDMSRMFDECFRYQKSGTAYTNRKGMGKFYDLDKMDTSSAKNMESMFKDCRVENLKDMKFNTKNVTNMERMFSGCFAESMDLSSFNTSKVKSMYQMFLDSEAKSLDLSSFDTKNVTDMSEMFQYSKAEELNLSSFNTFSVTNMAGMFLGSQAKILDLSSFDTTGVTVMSNMFYGADAERIDLSSFKTTRLLAAKEMFRGCKAEYLDLTTFDMNGVDLSQMFYDSKVKGVLAKSSADASILRNIDYLPQGLKITSKTIDEDGYVLAWDGDFIKEGGASTWTYIGKDEFVKIPNTIQGESPTSYYRMFYKSPVKGVKSYNKSIVSMEQMFSLASSKSLDISGLDTSGVTNMERMFENCAASELDLSTFDFSKVTKMTGIFKNAKASKGWVRTQALADFFNSLTDKPKTLVFLRKAVGDRDYDEDGYAYSKEEEFAKDKEGNWRYQGTDAYVIIPAKIQGETVTSYRFMFVGKAIGGVKSNNKNVTDASNMFASNTAGTLDLSEFDASSITNTNGMFSNSSTKIGYAKTKDDADKFNASENKPPGLVFEVKGLVKTPAKITTNSLKDGNIEKPYSAKLEATGDDPIKWTLEKGKLPKGLSLQENGEISGTPEEAGTFNFTLMAKNETDPGDVKEFSIKVLEAGQEVWENPFTDIKAADWFYNNVAYVNREGLMQGTSKTTFGPNGNTTRGMIVTILHRFDGSPKAGKNPFIDVDAKQYYADPIAWAAENNIVSGYGGGKFGPNDPITREQMAVILQNYAKFKSLKAGASGNISKYSDHKQVSSWATVAMTWANDEKLIQGSGDKLMPKGNATRAQVAAILNRFAVDVAGK